VPGLGQIQSCGEAAQKPANHQPPAAGHGQHGTSQATTREESAEGGCVGRAPAVCGELEA